MEEHFRNKLKNHKVDWDKEDLLPNLKNELASNSNKLSWSWLLLIPFLFVVSYWAWHSSMPLSNDQLLSDISVSKVEVDPSAVLNKTEDGTVLSHINEAKGFTKAKINSTSLNKVKNTNRTNKTKESSSSIIGKTQKQNKVSNQIFPRLDFNDLDTQQDQVLKSKLSQKINFELSAESKTLESSMAFKVYSMSDETVSTSANLSSKSLPYSNSHIGSNGNVATVNIFPNSLPFIELQEFEMEENVNIKPVLFQNNENETEIESKKSFHVQALGEVGLFSRERIYNTNNENLLNNLESNEETKSPLIALHTNLNFGYQHASGWSLQSGLEYSEFREIFNYEESNTEIISKDTFSYIIIDLVGDTTFVQAPKNFLESTDRTVRHYNKHRFYSIPIQLGYQFDLKKANLTTRLGLSYTFAHSFKGRVSQVTLDESNIVLDDPVFELKNRLGLQVGFILEYPFLKDTRLVFSASYRRSPQLNFDMIDQRYNSFSLGAGVKFSLGGDN